MQIYSSPNGGEVPRFDQENLQEPADLKISIEEFAFSILNDSHLTACQALWQFVLAAVKASHPVDWKDKICACFTDTLRHHIKKCLDDSCPLEDIYAICKIIRCRLKDVSRYVGESLRDPRQKEWLSLQVQGVEAVRNWAFHGERITPLEVISSICVSISILTTLQCRQDSITKLEDYLRKLQTHLLALKTSGAQEFTEILLPTIWRAVLYKNLYEFENEFSKDNFPAEEMQPKWSSSLKDGLQNVIRFIKAELSKPQKERMNSLKGEETMNKGRPCIKRCVNISTIRNKLAHNLPLNEEEVFSCLSDICHLLTTFGLSCERTTFSLNSLTSLKTSTGHARCLVVGDVGNEMREFRRRILRPKADHFIGREKDVASIMAALTLESDQRKKVVLLFGTAGIGKSYLATKICYDLRDVYPQQKWLCCSFQADEIFSEHAMQSAWLVVLDDVCLTTAQIICNEFMGSRHVLIITTRSTPVKELFLKAPSSLLVVELQPFSELETYGFFKIKTRSKFDERLGAWAQRTARRALNNLPLGVNIFFSYMAANSKKFERSFLSATDCDLSFCKWRNIEENFGDRLHIRGVTGVLKIAENLLEDRPLILFLIAKICSVNRERLPWAVVVNNSNWILKAAEHLEEDALQELQVNLFGVVDWLFSSEAKVILENCRDELEKLGLITWDKEMATVIIHSLTLNGMRSSLIENHLSLHNLIAFCCRRPADGVDLQKAGKFLLESLWKYLYVQVLSACMDALYGWISKAARGYGQTVIREVEGVYNLLSSLAEEASTVCQLPCPLEHSSSKDLRSDSLQIPWTQVASCLFNFLCESPFTFHFISQSAFLVQLLSGFRSDSRDLARAKELANFQCFWDRFKSLSFLTEGPKEASEFALRAILQLPILCCFKNALGSAGDDIREYLFQLIREAQDNLKDNVVQTEGCLENPVLRKSKLLLKHMEDLLAILQDETMSVEAKQNILFSAHIMADLLVYSLALMIQYFFGIVKGKQFKGEKAVLTMIKFLQESQQLFQKHQPALTLPECMCPFCFSQGLHAVNEFVPLHAYTEAALWNLVMKPGRALQVMVRIFQFLLPNFKLASCVVNGEFKLTDKAFRSEELTEQIHALLSSISSLAWLSGNYTLPLRLIADLEPSFKMETSTQLSCELVASRQFSSHLFSGISTLQRNCDVQPAKRMANILAWQGLSTLYETFNFSLALELFLNSFVLNVAVFKFSSKFQMPSRVQFEDKVFIERRFIPLLCAFLERAAAQQAATLLKQALEDEYIKDELVHFIIPCASSIIHNINILCNMAKVQDVGCHFAKLAEPRKQSNNLAARKVALQCWRCLVLVSSSKVSLAQGRFSIYHFLSHMFLYLADHLRQIYRAEGKHSIVHWFCFYLLDVAGKLDEDFLVAKSQYSYIEYLMDTDQLSEALEQSLALHVFMVDTFGEDFLDWLPDAPKTVDICKILNSKLEKKATSFKIETSKPKTLQCHVPE